jgi:hypothetical protein
MSGWKENCGKILSGLKENYGNITTAQKQIVGTWKTMEEICISKAIVVHYEQSDMNIERTIKASADQFRIKFYRILLWYNIFDIFVLRTTFRRKGRSTHMEFYF